MTSARGGGPGNFGREPPWILMGSSAGLYAIGTQKSKMLNPPVSKRTATSATPVQEHAGATTLQKAPTHGALSPPLTRRAPSFVGLRRLHSTLQLRAEASFSVMWRNPPGRPTFCQCGDTGSLIRCVGQRPNSSSWNPKSPNEPPLPARPV